MKINNKQKLIAVAISTILSGQAYADCSSFFTEGDDGTLASPVICTGNNIIIFADEHDLRLDTDTASAQNAGTDIVTFDGFDRTKANVYADTFRGVNGAVGADNVIKFINSKTQRLIGGVSDSSTNSKMGANKISLSNKSVILEDLIGNRIYLGDGSSSGSNTIIVDDSTIAKTIKGATILSTNSTKIQGNTITVTGGTKITSTTDGGIFGVFMKDSNKNTVKTANIISVTDSSSITVKGVSDLNGDDNTIVGNELTITNSQVDNIYGTDLEKTENTKVGGNTITIDGLDNLAKGDIRGLRINDSTNITTTSRNTISVKNSKASFIMGSQVAGISSITKITNAGSDITVDNTEVSRLFASNFNNVTGDVEGNTVTVQNNSKVTGGLRAVNIDNTGSKDVTVARNTITVNDSEVGTIYSTVFTGSNMTGSGSDISITKSTVAADVYGDFFQSEVVQFYGTDF